MRSRKAFAITESELALIAAGGASLGVLFRDAEAIELLGRVEVVVVDKHVGHT